MVECIALGGNPGHFGRLCQEQFVVTPTRSGVLAPEAARKLRKQRARIGETQLAFRGQLLEELQISATEWVARGRRDAVDRRLERFREPFGMQLADEELRQFLRVVFVRV